MQEDKVKNKDAADREQDIAAGNDEVLLDEKIDSKDKALKLQDKRVVKLEKALAQAEEEKNAFKDSYQRTFSDFNNFKKRNTAAISCAMKDGSCDTIAKILPVLDNFERALVHAEEQEDSAFANGVSLVYKQLVDILAGMCVIEIPSLGEPFDPNVHHAIQQVEVAQGEAEPNTVVAVVQKGYMLGDKILRHSMVIVSK